MTEHAWTALGVASVDDGQASAWVNAPALEVIPEALAVHFSTVVCADCLQDPDGAEADCPGPKVSPPGHVWQMMTSAALDAEQLAQWKDPDLAIDVRFPQTLQVVCVLCGQLASDFDRSCPERVLRTTTGERVPHLALRHGIDADLHIVAEPDEEDAHEWRVVELNADGSTAELRRERFVSTGFGPYEGRPAWLVGRDFAVEMHIPGRTTPYVITGGHFETMTADGPTHGVGYRETPR